MGHPVHFKGCTHSYAAPPDRDDMSDLPLYSWQNGIVTCWELSPEELDEINRTGCVYVAVLGNKGIVHPMCLGSRSAVRSVTVDYGGIW